MSSSLPSPSLESLVERATQGDRHALERLLEAIRHDLYGIAVRMLWCPHDAADATQEILIKIFTSLASFRRDAKFRTWTHRIAVNHLLNVRRSRGERASPASFEALEQELSAEPLAPPPEVGEPERSLLESEVRIGCTQAMLLCLDRDHRMAYILGELLGLDHVEAAECLAVTTAAFRKRLSRARARVEEFVTRRCGLVRPELPCRCAARTGHAIARGWVDPQALLFARHPLPEVSVAATEQVVASLHRLRSGAELMRSLPLYRAPDDVGALGLFRDDR